MLPILAQGEICGSGKILNLIAHIFSFESKWLLEVVVVSPIRDVMLTAGNCTPRTPDMLARHFCRRSLAAPGRVFKMQPRLVAPYRSFKTL